MNIVRKILIKSIVRQYYKQNAGLFAFLIFIMVAAVGRANGVGLLEYHFSLIQGMMTNPSFLIIVLSAWLLYAVKCEQFFADTIKRQEYAFLSLLSLKNSKTVYIILLQIQFLLFLPVLIYAFIALWIGFNHNWIAHSIFVVLFILTINLVSAWWYKHLLKKSGKIRSAVFFKISHSFRKIFYCSFITRFVMTSRKILFVVIKLFSCLILYGMLVNRIYDESDLQMVLLFYSFGILGHGVLIYKIRGMEETQLNFYRSLPVSIIRRFIQYGWLYLFIFIPEILVIKWFTPAHLSYHNAFLLIFFGYSVILFLNSLLFIKFFRMVDYLKIIGIVYLMIVIAVLTGLIAALSVLLFFLSLYLFYTNYYMFENP